MNMKLKTYNMVTFFKFTLSDYLGSSIISADAIAALFTYLIGWLKTGFTFDDKYDIYPRFYEINLTLLGSLSHCFRVTFFPKGYGYINLQFKNHSLNIITICSAILAIWSDVFKSNQYRYLEKQENKCSCERFRPKEQLRKICELNWLKTPFSTLNHSILKIV